MRGDSLSRSFGSAAIAVAGCVASLCAEARAQPVWVVSNAGAFLEVHTYANDFGTDFGPLDPLGIGFADTQTAANLIAGYKGLDYGRRLQSYVIDENFFATPNTYMSSTAIGEVTINGENTIELEMNWKILTENQAWAPEEFEGDASSVMSDVPNALDFFVELNTTGVPAGTPLIIYYYWDASARGFSKFEPPGVHLPPLPPDFSRVMNTALEVNGQDLLNGLFAFDITPPFVSVDYTLKNQGGQVNTTAGTTITIHVRGEVESGIYAKGRGFLDAEDRANALFEGRLRISVGTPPIPGPPGGLASLGASIPDFSVDIGGDAELSEFPGPLPEAIEVFDPGDVYQWMGPPLPVGGANGYLDDDVALLGDQFPVPMMVPPTQAPICTGPLPNGTRASFFDLDGHDELDFSIIGLIDPIAPLAAPITAATLNSGCLFGAEFLFVSYEDDAPLPYNECQIPNNTLSPLGVIHGDSVERDEVVGVTIYPVAPAPVTATYPLAPEDLVHVSMSPNPDGGNDDFDDDVDSLDMPLDTGVCTTWLFSSDHEAPGYNALFPGLIALNPGAIYQVVPGAAPVQVIDPQIHLGLSAGTDVGDFEFAWLEDTVTGTGAMSLALIFCVHSDNPATADDESGGLDPRMLHYSFLSGRSFPLLTGPLDDAVDAVTSFQYSLAPAATVTPPCCPGDADQSQFVDFSDINAVLANWGSGGPVGDANCDGIVDFTDITAVIANWFSACP